MKRIITHPGTAHRDEVLAIAVLLAHHGKTVPVCRREPNEAELADPSVLVIDCGGRHAPALSNFDHHHYEGGDCAFHLVMKHLGHHEYATEIFPWYNVTNNFDVHGPHVALKSLGIRQEVAAALRSPLEGVLLRLFSRQAEVEPWLLELLMRTGNEILGKTGALSNRMRELELSAQIVSVKGVEGIASVIESDPCIGLSVFRTRHAPDAAFSICPDDRGPGNVLYRFDDDPRIDFSVLDNDPRISFAHRGGFIAKTGKRESIEELLDLVERGIVAG